MPLSSPFPDISHPVKKPRLNILPEFALKDNEIFSAISLGLCSIVSQIILVRELVTIFYGTELIYIVGLAGWWFWFAIGVWQAIFPDYVKKVRQALLTLWILLAAFSPLSILAIRIVPGLLGLEVGEKAGIVEMSLISFLVVAPVSLILGQIFSFLCRWVQVRSRSIKLMGEIYGVEALGAAIGGIIFCFILHRWFSNLMVAWAMSFVSIVACWCILKTKRALVVIIGSIVLSTLLGLWAIPRLENFVQNQQWQNWTVLGTMDSSFGNVTLVKQADEYALFENGLRSYSTANDSVVKENIRFALSAHTHPQRILLVGHGLNGELREILQASEAAIDYIEFNPQSLQMVRPVLPSSVQNDLDNVRVRVIEEEARSFMKSLVERYDIIILNVGDPQTVLTNRYYTREFFREIYSALRPEGVVSFSIPFDYLDPGNQMVLRSLNAALNNVFPSVQFKKDMGVFLAKKGTGNLPATRLDTAEMGEIEKIFKIKAAPNTDMNPVEFLYLRSMNYRDSGLKQCVMTLQKLKGGILLLPVLLFAVGYFIEKRQKSRMLVFSVLTTGFSQSTFQVLIILIFQILFGNAYERFAWVVTALAIGLVGGNWRARGFVSVPGSPTAQMYKNLQLNVILLPLSLPLFLFFAQWITFSKEWEGLFTILMVLITFALGWLIGFQHLLAIHYFNKQGVKIAPAKQASVLTLVYVFGAALGALLSGYFFLPLYGVAGTVALCASLNIAIWFLLKKFFDLKVSNL